MSDMVDYIFNDMSDMKRSIRKLHKTIKAQRRFNFMVLLFAIGVALYVDANDKDIYKLEKDVKEIKQELEGEL